MTKRLSLKIALSILLLFPLLQFMSPAEAAATWTASSNRDTYDRPDLDARYNLEYVSASIFDNSTDQIYFYLHFKSKPRVDLFNDGQGSWAFVGLDYNSDDKSDVRLEIYGKTLKTDRTSVLGEVYDARDQSFPNCNVDVFTNLDEDRWWIGFAVSRSCIKLPATFGIQGYSDFLEKDEASFDYAPDDHFTINLPGATASPGASSGAKYQLPKNIANESTSLQNYSSPPTDLTKLSEKLTPSVVTIFCSDGKGSGWSVKSEFDGALKSGGYKSYVITNHHVIEDCISSGNVRIQLSSGKSTTGILVGWNEDSDVAGIATTEMIPPLEWIGASPKQGWWIGVLGSPGSLIGILTTGIISSINNEASTFTFTAPINPGNSGGPIFDASGRVLGLATSKNLLSNGSLAEGSGNGHGVPLLCGSVIVCEIEKKPWGSTSKFADGPTAAELELIAKAEADARAKAEADARAKAEADARAAFELKLKEEKFRQCTEFNGNLNLVRFKLNASMSIYPSSQRVFQGLIDASPAQLDCLDINVQTFDAEMLNQRKLLSALEISVADAVANAKIASTKKKTISCVRGNTVRKVTAVNPKCPKGFKKN